MSEGAAMARFLEVTFRKGKPIAAYLYLSSDTSAKSHRTKKTNAGLILDYGDSDQLIGIEITSPSQSTLMTINGVLTEHELPGLGDDELSPLMAA